MRIPSAVFAAVLVLSATPALAEIVEVKMLNRGETGSMVYEPDYVELAPGDTIRFLVGHRSHNAASIEGMAPEGFEHFIGRIDEEIEVTFDEAGTYGIKCSPHYGMGMVMVVKVGDEALDTDIADVEMPPRARQRFEEIFARAEGGE